MTKIFGFSTILIAFLSFACASKTPLCQPQTAYYSQEEIRAQITQMRKVASELILEARSDGSVHKRSLAIDATTKLELASASTDPTDQREEMNEAYKLLEDARTAN